MKEFINYLMFTLFWYALVTLQNQAVLFAWSYLLIHFFISDHKKTELYTIVSVSVLGIICDQCLLLLGYYQFTPPLSFLPIWFLTMWLLFATLFQSTLVFCHKFKKILLALAGAILGPITYCLGSVMSPVFDLAMQPLDILVIAIVWAVLFPLCIHLSLVIKEYYQHE